MIKLSGLTGSLTGNADKLGVLAGLFAGTTSGFTDVMSIIDEIMKGNIHMPNWAQIVPVATPFLKQAVITYLAGTLASELNLPFVGNLGGALKKGAIGYGATSFLLHVLYYSTHASEGSNPVTGANSFLAQAPAISNYNY